MVGSATRRRTETADRITASAQRLTDERGLDGFTMDDLADAAEVSRRTLFNYFSGKVDAILGRWPTLAEADADEFRAGGPDGDLLADLRAMLLPLLVEHVTDRAAFLRFKRILLADPRLLGSVHGRYEELSARIVGHIGEREGPDFGTPRAKVAVGLLAAVFDAALDAYLGDQAERPFMHHFDQVLATARSLLGGPAT